MRKYRLKLYTEVASLASGGRKTDSSSNSSFRAFAVSLCFSTNWKSSNCARKSDISEPAYKGGSFLARDDAKFVEVE